MIELTEQFVEKFQGFYKNPNRFNAVQLPDDRWVCDKNSLNEFPEIFEGVEIKIIEE